MFVGGGHGGDSTGQETGLKGGGRLLSVIARRPGMAALPPLRPVTRECAQRVRRSFSEGGFLSATLR